MGGGLAGENSEIELYKANAKQKDVTGAAKILAGWTKPEDRGSRRYSSVEKANISASEKVAGILVKINNVWSFMVGVEDYSGLKYRLISANKEGWAGVEDNSRGYSYTRQELAAGELSKLIDFSQKVDVYIVKVDENRRQMRADRAESKSMSKVSKEKINATKKFLDKKSNNIISTAKLVVEGEVNKFMETVQSALSNNVIDINVIKKSIDEFKSNLDNATKDLSGIIYYYKYVLDDTVNGIPVKDISGTNRYSYSYSKFKESANSLKSE